MERSQRIARINALLAQRNGVSMAQMMEELEVSRATISRDLELMRDQMNAPIVWDNNTGTYRLDDAEVNGPAYMVPGMWLSPAQAYAFLTLNNMVEKIAPSLLGPFIEPMRETLKRMLGYAEFQLYGLDQKIEIDMPEMPQLPDQVFTKLLNALVHEQRVYLSLVGQESQLYGMPIKLKISPERWLIDFLIESGDVVNVDVVDVLGCVEPFGVNR